MPSPSVDRVEKDLTLVGCGGVSVLLCDWLLVCSGTFPALSSSFLVGVVVRGPASCLSISGSILDGFLGLGHTISDMGRLFVVVSFL